MVSKSSPNLSQLGVLHPTQHRVVASYVHPSCTDVQVEHAFCIAMNHFCGLSDPSNNAIDGSVFTSNVSSGSSFWASASACDTLPCNGPYAAVSSSELTSVENSSSATAS